MRGYEGVRWAGLNTAGASSTAVGGRRVRSEFNRSNDYSKKEPRPDLLIDQARILSQPANPCVPCVDPLDDWPGINVGACLDLLGLAKTFGLSLDLPEASQPGVVVATITGGLVSKYGYFRVPATDGPDPEDPRR